MARSLIFAYFLSLTTLFAVVALGRGLLLGVDGPTAFFYRSILGLLFLPAAVLFIRGGNRSSGSLRKVLAYGLSFTTAFLGFGSLVAAILVLTGSAKPG
jgi:hypothetical protein